MDILNSDTLRQRARTALRRGREPQKLIYTYAGISLAISVIIYVASLWLDQQISGTGGLGNLGTRAVFETARQAIPVLSGLVAMCLDLGFLSGLMRISRGQYADHTDLKTGFRKFWPLMRLNLLQTVLFFAIAFLSLQVGSMIFLFTPWAGPVVEVLEPLYASGNFMIPDALVMELFSLMVPLFLIICVIFAVAMLPCLFKLRMAYFCLLDDPRGRALAAMLESNRMMRRRFGQMLKLDLKLWLYYAGVALTYVVLWADVILAMLGISIPMNANLVALLVYVASAGLQFAVHVFLRPEAEVTYLTVYDQLREKPKDDGVVLGNIFDM